MANGNISPYDLSRIHSVLQDAKRNVAMWKEEDALDKHKFKGDTTEVFNEMIRGIDKRIQKRLGEANVGSGGGIGQVGKLVAAAPVDPVTKAVVTFVTNFLGGDKQRKRAIRAIDESEKILGTVDTKYEKSWLGEHLKNFVNKYEKEFTNLRQQIPSKGSMLTGAIVDSLISYGEAGGKKEMDRVRAGRESGDLGFFTGEWGDSATPELEFDKILDMINYDTDSKTRDRDFDSSYNVFMDNLDNLINFNRNRTGGN